MPDGQLFHVVGATPGGWTIFGLHDSPESWERFRNGVVATRSPEIGWPEAPQETTFEVHTFLSR